MGDFTKIQWTDSTWNPVRGCSRCSPGCFNCYAERQAYRFSGPGQPFDGFVQIANGHPQWTGKVGLVENHLLDPLKWRKPRRIFVNSMSDLFHENMPLEAIDRVIAVMHVGWWHTYQVLTKRAELMAKYFRDPDLRRRVFEVLHDGRLFPGDPRRAVLGNPSRAGIAEGILKGWRSPCPDHIWLGASTENQKYYDERIAHLARTPAKTKFLSVEPMIGAIDFHWPKVPGEWLDVGSSLQFDASGPSVSWVIVGGESGPGARPFDIGWARSIVNQCRAAGVACFVKQLGADPREGNRNENCRNLDCTHPDCGYVRMNLKDRKGGDIEEWPEELRVREFPKS